MQIHSTMPRWGQALAGGTLLAIAMTAGSTGLWINVHHGLEIRPEAGILFGLADLTKIVLPIVCGLIGWTLQTRLTAAVCVGTSLFCAVMAFNSGADQKLAGKQHGADQYSLVKADVAKIEAEVTSLNAQAASEAKNGGCGKQCKYLNDRADKARQALAEAQNRLSAAKPVAISENAFLTSRISAVIFLVLIEALVWMSVPAMTLMEQAMRSEPEISEKPKQRKARKPIRKQAAKQTDWTKVDAYTKAPRLNKAGKIDGRTKEARAVKRVVGTRVLA